MKSLIDRESYETKPNSCLFCKKPLSYEKKYNKFCSRQCNGKYSSQINQKFCPCGKPAWKKYCSLQCQMNFQWIAIEKNIELNQCAQNKVQAKKYLLKKCGNICSICKNSEWMGQKIPLIIDHINGHSENHSLNNIRLVCGNCDMQLPTYKSKNRGNGSFLRRQRYKEGKSY